jgi:hypothetical protein
MNNNEKLNCLRYYFYKWIYLIRQDSTIGQDISFEQYSSISKSKFDILCFNNICDQQYHRCKRCIVNVNLADINGKFTIKICNDKIGDCWKFQDILDDLHINKSLHAKPWHYTKIYEFNIIDSTGNMYDRNTYLKDCNLQEYKNNKMVDLYIYPSKCILEKCKCMECKQKIQIMNLKITSLKRIAMRRKQELKKTESEKCKEIDELTQKKKEKNRIKNLRKKSIKKKREVLKRKEEEKYKLEKKKTIVHLISDYTYINIQKYIKNDIYNSHELYIPYFVNKIKIQITLLYIKNIKEEQLLNEDNIQCVANIIYNSPINFLIEIEKLITKEYSNYFDRLIQKEKKLKIIYNNKTFLT